MTDLMSRRVLVAGVGNIFFGDDGFGSEVARVLLTRDLAEGVRVRRLRDQGNPSCVRPASMGGSR